MILTGERTRETNLTPEERRVQARGSIVPSWARSLRDVITRIAFSCDAGCFASSHHASEKVGSLGHILCYYCAPTAAAMARIGSDHDAWHSPRRRNRPSHS